MSNTPKEDRNDAFYFDAFTSMTTWSANMWRDELASHGIEESDDEMFGATAERLWNAYTEEERAEFASDYDDWLDA